MFRGDRMIKIREEELDVDGVSATFATNDLLRWSPAFRDSVLRLI